MVAQGHNYEICEPLNPTTIISGIYTKNTETQKILPGYLIIGNFLYIMNNDLTLISYQFSSQDGTSIELDLNATIPMNSQNIGPIQNYESNLLFKMIYTSSQHIFVAVGPYLIIYDQSMEIISAKVFFDSNA
jgi:hypothetical protein